MSAAIFLALIVAIAPGKLDAAALQETHRKAQHFIDDESQFHLGVLPTEQSNPKTAGLAERAQEDLSAAIRMLQAADDAIPPKAAQVLASGEFQRLVGAMRRAIEGRGQVCFSGCGATGRLSILLETIWRQFWQELKTQRPALAARLPNWEDRVESIMTGGDYALIRSVENFEDFSIFGRRQVQEARLGRGDVLVAITEGRETPSVIGTVWQAVDNGAQVFFVFNNPTEILARHIERSRQVLGDARIVKLDLACGPMAVTGSTRMQATTCELLIVGAALEIALTESLRARLGDADLAALHVEVRKPADFGPLFVQLLQGLGQPAAVAAIGGMIRFEEQVYRRKGLVTYMAGQCLLDIFTDTTERSPTFMLPRFRPSDDHVSPPSWAFVKDPLSSTPQAWRRLLRREPRCLAWNAETYRALGAPPRLQEHPPRLAAGEMLKFKIGNEDDTSRYRAPDSAAILIAIGEEVKHLSRPHDPLRAVL
jgi:N-acetylmuramic acid 6-phosphate etherase